MQTKQDDQKIKEFEERQQLPPKKEELKPNQSAFKPLTASPKFKDDYQLRPYQVEGVSWIYYNWHIQKNCILADEM